MIVTNILRRASCQKQKVLDYETLVPRFIFKKGISKNIFGIFLHKGKSVRLSQDLQNARQMLERLNPGWQSLLYENDEARSFILQNYGEVILSYYNRIDRNYGAARADFLRYLLLYKYGGVYLDLKCICDKPFDNVFSTEDTFFLSTDQESSHPEWPDINGRFYSNIFMVSSKGHPLIREVIIETLRRIDNYNPYVDGVGWRGVIVTTGPYMYSKVIGKYLAINDPPVTKCLAKDIMGYHNMYEPTEKEAFKYQERNRMTDYRKQTRPVIRHRNILLNSINVIYLSILNKIMR